MVNVLLNIFLLLSLAGCAAVLHFFIMKVCDVLEYSIGKEVRHESVRSGIRSGGTVRDHDDIVAERESIAGREGSADGSSTDGYSEGRYSEDGHSSGRNSEDRYSTGSYSEDRYSTGRYSKDRYSTGRKSEDRYSTGKFSAHSSGSVRRSHA